MDRELTFAEDRAIRVIPKVVAVRVKSPLMVTMNCIPDIQRCQAFDQKGSPAAEEQLEHN